MDIAEALAGILVEKISQILKAAKYLIQILNYSN